jgi:hypothetical protein
MTTKLRDAIETILKAHGLFQEFDKKRKDSMPKHASTSPGSEKKTSNAEELSSTLKKKSDSSHVNEVIQDIFSCEIVPKGGYFVNRNTLKLRAQYAFI